MLKTFSCDNLPRISNLKSLLKYFIVVLLHVFFSWVVRVLHRFWIQVLYQICNLQTFFSHSLGCLLILLFFFAEKKFFIRCSPTYLFLLWSPFTSVTSPQPKKSLLRLVWRSFFPMFIFRSFTVSGLKFKSSNHFELIFVCSLRCIVSSMDGKINTIR